MNNVEIKAYKSFFFIDLMILGAVLLIPAISHLLPFPLYIIDPMRILLFTGFILSRNTNNALILALLIPWASLIVSGHPNFFKVILISVELTLNIYIFKTIVARFNKYVFASMMLAICTSKVIYYIMKYCFLSFEYLTGELISTSIQIQCIIALIISIIFSIFYKKYEGYE